MGTTISPGKVNLYNQVFQSVVAMPFQQRHSLSTAKDLITFIKNVLLVICYLFFIYLTFQILDFEFKKVNDFLTILPFMFSILTLDKIITST